MRIAPYIKVLLNHSTNVMKWVCKNKKVYFVGLQVYVSPYTAVCVNSLLESKERKHSWYYQCIDTVWKEYWICFRYFCFSLICTEKLTFLTTLLHTHLYICRSFWGQLHKLWLLVVKSSFWHKVTIYTTKYLSIAPLNSVET